MRGAAGGGSIQDFVTVARGIGKSGAKGKSGVWGTWKGLREKEEVERRRGNRKGLGGACIWVCTSGILGGRRALTSACTAASEMCPHMFAHLGPKGRSHPEDSWGTSGEGGAFST